MADMMQKTWSLKVKKANPPAERESEESYQPRRSSNYIPSHHELPSGTPFSVDPHQNSFERSDLSSERRDLELTVATVRLPPILTRLPTNDEEDIISSPSLRRYPKNIQCRKFNCLSKSFAVVKFSSNPQRDFRESMEEMIRENNITSSRDLEELLACFLSLNSGEYRGDIFRAFEEIRSDLAVRRRRESFRPKHCR